MLNEVIKMEKPKINKADILLEIAMYIIYSALGLIMGYYSIHN